MKCRRHCGLSWRRPGKHCKIFCKRAIRPGDKSPSLTSATIICSIVGVAILLFFDYAYAYALRTDLPLRAVTAFPLPQAIATLVVLIIAHEAIHGRVAAQGCTGSGPGSWWKTIRIGLARSCVGGTCPLTSRGGSRRRATSTTRWQNQRLRPARYFPLPKPASPLALASRAKAAPACAWVIARPRASAASGPGSPGRVSSRRTIS